MIVSGTELKGYVIKADDDILSVVCHSIDLARDLEAVGFEQVESKLTIFCETEVEKAGKMALLRDLGIPFAAGREWSPSEVFEYLRDKKLIEGMYLRVAWRDPDSPYIVTA
jgi:hypothetical protein